MNINGGEGTGSAVTLSPYGYHPRCSGAADDETGVPFAGAGQAAGGKLQDLIVIGNESNRSGNYGGALVDRGVELQGGAEIHGCGGIGAKSDSNRHIGMRD